jgi:predicted ATPase/class 3 adenylate cyclase
MKPAEMQMGAAVRRGGRPTGTVTLLFTDVEGSTRLLHELGALAYADALAEHRRVLRDAFAAHGGVEVDTQGDAFFVAFTAAGDAVAAAAQGLVGLARGPIRVRVGLHTGTPHATPEGYVGPDVHKAARIAAAGHGGQVLLSRETRERVEGAFQDLGEHRLKDFADPVWIFQAGDAQFPPLNTISTTNLPRPASSFVGRERDLETLTALLRDGARLVTLTGPGGSGKTRLAIETAAALVPDFRAGVFWVGLTSVRDAALVPDAIGQVLGALGGLAEHIGDRRLLLVVDNLEHLVDAAAALAALVERCPNLRLLVTSRERLRVRGEWAHPVLALPEAEAVELFCARAGSAPDGDTRTLCRALDCLPLAVELAAARTSVLSPRMILDRLSGRLDLLRGGRDAEPRQRTLRATIEWSHDLLPGEERCLFARLAAFAGGCTIAAAEEVAEAGLDPLQALVDRSLIRHADGRFWMLETIREFAAERLAASDEAGAVRARHAAYFLALGLRQDAELRAGVPEEGPVAILEAEIDNLRATVDAALGAGAAEPVREITAALRMYWVVRGRYGEGRSWLERALALHGGQDDVRRRLLAGLAEIAYLQGDHLAAVAASDACAALAGTLGGAADRLELLQTQGSAALMRGDLRQAETRFRDGFMLASAVDNGVATSACRLHLAYIANASGRRDEGQALLLENLGFVRGKGQARCEAATLASLGEAALRGGRPHECTPDALLGAARALQIRDTPIAVCCLDLFAASAAARVDARRTAMILGATEAARDAMGVAPDADEQATREHALNAMGGAARVAGLLREGRALELEAALELAQAATHDMSTG